MGISSGKLRQSIVLIVVVTVVGALLSIYFFVYIDTKEEDINRRNFNALLKNAHNIRQKIVEYASNRVTQNYLTYNLDYIWKAQPTLRKDLDGLKKYLKYEIEVKDRHELTLDSLKKVIVEKTVNGKRQKSSLKKNGIIELTEQTLKFVFRDTLSLCVSDSLDCSDCKCKDEQKLKYFAKSTIPVSRFIEPLLNRDIFTEYVIISPLNPKNESIIYESRSLGAVDSLKAVSKSVRNEVVLNGVTYRVFRFPFTVDKYDWVLIGLQDSESYLKEARSFDLSLLYTILLTAITLLLSLPLIKVVLISRNEKLNRADVILCGVSILTSCFFWTIIISEWDYEHLYKENAQRENALKALSRDIEEQFTAEIDSAYKEMVRAEYTPVRDELINLRFSAEDDSTSYRPIYKKFDVISWIENDGMQLRKWATNYKVTKKINVSKRAYFTQVRDQREWSWREGQKIVIESIISWNNAEHLAVISKASTPRFPMVAMTTPLPSVINCTLPQGYKFCIADQQGNVWFHSDANKNLSENIFEECNITPTINNFLYKTGENSMVVVYENSKHQIDIKPMNELPLYLVTLKDLSMEDQSKVYVLQVTFVFLLIYVLIIMLAAGITALTWKRSLKRHITTRSLDWVKPDEDRIKLYISIAMLNLGLTVLLLLFAGLLSPANEIIILLLTPLYVLPVYFLSLNNQNIQEFLKPINRTLLSVILFTIIIFNISFFIRFEASALILVYQLLLISLISGWLLFARYLKEKYLFVRILNRLKIKRKFFKTISLRTAYSLAFASLCFILGVIPVFQFHRHAFNLERIKNAMATQYNMLKETSAKPKSSRRVYLVKGMDITPGNNESRTSPENFRDFEKLTRFVSPVIDTAGIGFIKRGHLFYTYVNDQRWAWSTDSAGRLCFAPDSEETVNKSLRSTLQNYRSPQIMGWTAGILGLVALFVASRYLTARIFIFDVNRNLVEADLFIVRAESKKTGISDRELLQEPLLNNHLFIIGLPFSGERDYVDKLHPPEKHKRLIVDLIEVSNSDQWNAVAAEKATNEKYEIIIVDHFEYDFQNEICNNSKLILMEKLFLMWKKKIVILSTIHPSQFLECYGADTKSKERWNTIFSHFYNIYYPLQKERLSKSAIMKEYNIDGRKWQRNEHYYEFIEKECSHGLFLQNLKPALYSLVDIANKNNLTIEELSDKVKSLSYTYYASIWASCSKDERFLIYDLAEDGLVNVKNDESIVQLIYKGIFIQKRTLSIMNRSFRNFVLAYINPTEVLEMRKETLSFGTWSRLKGPILFILIIAILFLLYTQKGFSDQIMAFLTTIAAGIPLIIKLLALIETPGKSKEKQ